MSSSEAERLSADQLRGLVRTVPDFPEPGIQFRDITTLVGDGHGLASCVSHLAERTNEAGADVIAGMEARGFIFGAAVAAYMGKGFVPIRKPGKLPVPTIGVDYALEYGTDRLEMDPASVRDGAKVIIIDDLIATGGTALASAKLLRQAGAHVEHALFVIDLPDLGGANLLRADGLSVSALMDFEGD